MILCAIPFLAPFIGTCAPDPLATGYVEGEYRLLAPLTSGRIETVKVRLGEHVSAGALLAQMDDAGATHDLAQAEAQLANARATLGDLTEGQRPEEIRALEATLASAQAQADEADRTAARMTSLAARGAATEAQKDDAVTAASVAHASVAEAEANLAVGRLPSRRHEIEAAQATVEADLAARDKAQWTLDQMRLTAPVSGRIDDVIRHSGEIAGPSSPLLSLLPDDGIKLKVYFGEAAVAGLSPGDVLRISCNGCAQDLKARVSYIADAPEFTPPVIYSLQNSHRLVYLVEALPSAPGNLKPGQIVQVSGVTGPAK